MHFSMPEIIATINSMLKLFKSFSNFFSLSKFSFSFNGLFKGVMSDDNDFGIFSLMNLNNLKNYFF